MTHLQSILALRRELIRCSTTLQEMWDEGATNWPRSHMFANSAREVLKATQHYDLLDPETEMGSLVREQAILDKKRELLYGKKQCDYQIPGEECHMEGINRIPISGRMYCDKHFMLISGTDPCYHANRGDYL